MFKEKIHLCNDCIVKVPAVEPIIIHKGMNIDMYIICFNMLQSIVDWRPTAEMSTLQQDPDNKCWPDVPHPLAHWYVKVLQ